MVGTSDEEERRFGFGERRIQLAQRSTGGAVFEAFRGGQSPPQVESFPFGDVDAEFRNQSRR